MNVNTGNAKRNADGVWAGYVVVSEFNLASPKTWTHELSGCSYRADITGLTDRDILTQAFSGQTFHVAHQGDLRSAKSHTEAKVLLAETWQVRAWLDRVKAKPLIMSNKKLVNTVKAMVDQGMTDEQIMIICSNMTEEADLITMILEVIHEQVETDEPEGA